MLISINWALLREQKTWLMNQPVCAEADGLVNLIDALQDGAVNDGVSEDVNKRNFCSTKLKFSVDG